jgi:hypothetical protein
MDLDHGRPAPRRIALALSVTEGQRAAEDPNVNYSQILLRELTEYLTPGHVAVVTKG